MSRVEKRHPFKNQNVVIVEVFVRGKTLKHSISMIADSKMCSLSSFTVETGYREPYRISDVLPYNQHYRAPG